MISRKMHVNNKRDLFNAIFDKIKNEKKNQCALSIEI